MTDEQRPQLPSATVHGAWQGAVGDPKRVFTGRVTQSSVEGLSVGADVMVSFQAPAERTTGISEHGTYTLQSGEHELKLMNFTTMTEATGGKHDTETEYWQATPLPG